MSKYTIQSGNHRSTTFLILSIILMFLSGCTSSGRMRTGDAVFSSDTPPTSGRTPKPAKPPAEVIEKKRFVDLARLRHENRQLITMPLKRRSEVIMPGDQLEITLYEKLPVSQEKRVEMKRVDDSGSVFLYPLGKIQLAGGTLIEARDSISRRMESYIVNPFCEIVLIKRAYEPHVFVFGESANRGSFPLKSGDRLLDILSLSGGATPKAYTSSIKIIRLYGDSVGVMSVNLKALLGKGLIEGNILMQDQDIVYLPTSLLSSATDVLIKLGSILPWYYFIKNF